MKLREALKVTRLQRRGRLSMSFSLGQEISRGGSSTSDILSPSLSTAIERLQDGI
jgi:hypothetical protein